MVNPGKSRSGLYPIGEFTAAFSTVAIDNDVNLPIHLEEDGTFPEMVLLVVDVLNEPPPQGGGSVPRLPDNEDLALDEGAFSDDIGTNRCVDFTKPNRVLEEFSYSYALRTTEPEIKGLTLEEPERISLGQISTLFPRPFFRFSTPSDSAEPIFDVEAARQGEQFGNAASTDCSKSDRSGCSRCLLLGNPKSFRRARLSFQTTRQGVIAILSELGSDDQTAPNH